MTPKALSREIKFRAWDVENNRWIYKDGYTLDELCANGYEIAEKLNVLVWLQFTGLHDKNGKEIYEGDIMKVLDRDWSDAEKDTKILIVYYRNDRYILINKAGIEESEKSEPNIYSKEWYEVSLFREYGRDKFEIIGNIYENPELLN